mmetsp:Transcript_17726/g.42702  ORF Transcript_17726/g.42702 Transcript_17726/m.42702 type:complete len:207 (+) Transcript_17726:339-959(+)
MNLNRPPCLLLIIALHALVDLLNQTRRKLGQTAFRGAVRGISRRTAPLHPAPHRIEHVSRKSTRLIGHDVHGNLRAVEDTQEVHLHDRLDLRHAKLAQRPTSAVDPRIIDPVSDIAQFALRELPQLFARSGIANVALGMEDVAVGMTRRQRLRGGGAILHVAYYHVVSAIHEFAGVGEAHSSGRAGDYDSSVGHGIEGGGGCGGCC